MFSAAEAEFLIAINNVSIAELIVRTLTNMNIEFNNVLAHRQDAMHNAADKLADYVTGDKTTSHQTFPICARV